MFRRKKSQNKSEESGNNVLKSLVAAYFILAFHVVLIAAMGCLILFFRGIIHYMMWIFIGCSSLILYSAFRIIKQMRDERKSIGEMLNTPVFQGRSVEISFMGGIASIKLGKPNPILEGPHPISSAILPIEDLKTQRIRELINLATLLEKGLITEAEFQQAKEQLFESMDMYASQAIKTITISKS